MYTFKANLRAIRPTQLYISEKKYRDCLALFEQQGFDVNEPLPIKKIGRDVFFTDGHTRALILWQNGKRRVNVYYEPDDLDWIMYLENLEWCRTRKIGSIQDLAARITSEQAYQEKWLKCCSESQARLLENPLADLVIDFEKDHRAKSLLCEEILRSLPQWFGIEEAIREYTEKVKELPFVTAILYGKVIGFCAVSVNYGINADLYVLAIFEEFHGRGIGTRMIEFVTAYCQQNAIPYMTVKTLSERHPDRNYQKTRQFYEKCGFRAFEEFPTLWGEGNPCLYMLKEVK